MGGSVKGIRRGEDMKKILIIEDEPNIRELILYNLKTNGYDGIAAEDGIMGITMVHREKPDLILLDLMLPGKSGYDICKELREEGNNVPIIMITAKTEETDKVTGLESGADDYISKPFMPQELLLRVYAVLRRTYKEDSPRVFLDGCTIDFSRAEVNKGGEIIPLTAKEHTLLETLARNEGKIVTVDALCEALWGDNPFGYENSLNAHVRRIREKIEADPSKPVSLITIKGLGYKLITRK